MFHHWELLGLLVKQHSEVVDLNTVHRRRKRQPNEKLKRKLIFCFFRPLLDMSKFTGPQQLHGNSTYHRQWPPITIAGNSSINRVQADSLWGQQLHNSNGQ
jgi:hypothetical protein